MLAGELYNANYDKELISERMVAKVKFGDNVVRGAGSVVNKDKPSNSVAVGVPCRVIKKLDS